jgi:hypothetical protein
MKNLVALIFFFSLFFPVSFCFSQTSDDVGKLDWIAGLWNRANVKAGRSAHERWEKVNDKEWRGWGVNFSGSDTTFVEKLKIVVKDNHIHYVAEVAHNAQPVYFKFTSLTSSGFICENPQHDFPKKIEYQLDNDKLTAIISGDGKSIPFVFTKKK